MATSELRTLMETLVLGEPMEKLTLRKPCLRAGLRDNDRRGAPRASCEEQHLRGAEK